MTPMMTPVDIGSMALECRFFLPIPVARYLRTISAMAQIRLQKVASVRCCHNPAAAHLHDSWKKKKKKAAGWRRQHYFPLHYQQHPHISAKSRLPSHLRYHNFSQRQLSPIVVLFQLATACTSSRSRGSFCALLLSSQ
jgi:hypothetical protein